MEERFSIEIAWKIHFQSMKVPEKLNLWALPHGILFFRERSGILEPSPVWILKQNSLMYNRYRLRSRHTDYHFEPTNIIK